MNDLAERVARFNSSLEDVCAAAGRSRNELTLIAVTKFHPAEIIRELCALGITDFGESRHQEAQEKAFALQDLSLNWHFVGQLQRNKAKQVSAYADVIHSVDRETLAAALAETDHCVECFVQINLTDNPARGGVSLAGTERLVEYISALPMLRLRGVMAVADPAHDPRLSFEKLRKASERVRSLSPNATAISAGMSHDFREAILEGATHLRIGSAITGNRPYSG